MKRPKRSGAGAKSVHLLDSSTLLWALGEPERLSARACRLVEAGENVASYWEVVIKTQKGLLAISDLATWWRQAAEPTAARVLPIHASHVTALAGFPALHKDPFDRWPRAAIALFWAGLARVAGCGERAGCGKKSASGRL